ncbi:hypothetical protein [Dactylosporangium sp. CA-092794]|uniref:hypothetical protein n=1 Tax=Dactylosporangium sp. CA-092794 TaxID=3239929 RepID=UPI003D90039D
MNDDDPRERLEALPDDEPDDADFAAEHEDSTFADETRGGPERSEEPESPRGRAGMD